MTTLGSCIAACLWDRDARVGGMNHFMLPDGGQATPAAGATARFAMELLINEMMKRGATRGTLEAKVFGGGQVIAGMNSINVGERNTRFVLDYLQTERIPVVSKDVLDIYPRKVCFLPASGKAMVKRLAPTNADGAAGAGARCGAARGAGRHRRRLGRPVLSRIGLTQQGCWTWPRHAWWWWTTRRWCAACWPRSSTASPTWSASAPPPTRWWRAR